jgi:hypothetical protein
MANSLQKKLDASKLLFCPYFTTPSGTKIILPEYDGQMFTNFLNKLIGYDYMDKKALIMNPIPP